MCSARHTDAASPSQAGVHEQNSRNPRSASPMGGQGHISAPASAPAPSAELEWTQQSPGPTCSSRLFGQKENLSRNPPPGEPLNPSPIILWNFNHHTSLSCFAQTQPKKAAGGWDPRGVEWGQRWGLAQGGIRICTSRSPRGQRAATLWHGTGQELQEGEGWGFSPAFRARGRGHASAQLWQHQPPRHQCQEHTEPQRILKELTAQTSAAFPVRNIPQPSNDARPLFRAFVTGPC